MDVTPSGRSTSAGRTPMSVCAGTTTAAPPSRPSMKTPVSIPAIDPPSKRLGEKMFAPDVGRELNDSGNQHEASALCDELDMLQEENDIIIDTLSSSFIVTPTLWRRKT